jgi:hypothetical protein
MSYRPNGDYTLDVLRGNVAGHARVNIRGHDTTVPSGGPFGLSPQFGTNSFQFDQSAISATPAVVGVASTDNVADIAAGTGALTVRVFGLDASGDAQSNDVTLTGQTAANTASTFSAVFQVLVLTTGSGNANAGTIYVGTGTFTAGVPAVRMLSIEAGFNISLSAYYVVPNAKTFYARQFVSTIATSNKDVTVFIETSSDGLQWNVQGPFGIESGSFATEVIALPGFVAGTHIRLRAAGGAINTIVTAILAGELVDD